MADKEYGFDTLKIQAGYDSADNKYSVSPPIYHTAAFDFRDTEHAENAENWDELVEENVRYFAKGLYDIGYLATDPEEFTNNIYQKVDVGN